MKSIKQLGDRLGRDLQGSMALANLLRNMQADLVSNSLLDLVLEQNTSTNLGKTFQSLSGTAIFDEGDDE